ncbi:MAG: hypothetical protein LBK99_24210, partial [Opitutaceae bacterium]|nr:hypothetical protein [Opitutaceae bacterium]
MSEEMDDWRAKQVAVMLAAKAASAEKRKKGEIPSMFTEAEIDWLWPKLQRVNCGKRPFDNCFLTTKRERLTPEGKAILHEMAHRYRIQVLGRGASEFNVDDVVMAVRHAAGKAGGVAGATRIPDLPALSIRGPWWWFILHSGKRHENRTWLDSNPNKKFRGDFLIHASLGCSHDEYDTACRFATWECGVKDVPGFATMERGGIVGRARIVDFVEDSVYKVDSPWFVGPSALVIDDPQPLPFTPCKGTLGFFRPQFPSPPPPPKRGGGGHAVSPG